MGRIIKDNENLVGKNLHSLWWIHHDMILDSYILQNYQQPDGIHCCRNDPGFPDSKVRGANMGPTWVLSAPDGPHVGTMNLAIMVWCQEPGLATQPRTSGCVMAWSSKAPAPNHFERKK